MTDELYERIRVMLRALLAHDSDTRMSEQDIDDIISTYAAPLAGDDLELLERLRRYVEEQVIVTAGADSTLDHEHTPWLSDRRADFDWRFWERYRRHLEEQSGLPTAVVNRLDETTDRILDHLEDPKIDGAWDRRGLIVGQVQSGKTANYLGLIAKAIDVGYRVVVVLAGADNDLRAQTQIRLEEGIIGWDTMGSKVDINNPLARKVGVGLIPSDGQFLVKPVTTRDPGGDFKAAQARVLQQIGSDPMILVVKKNKSVLQNVYKSLTSVSADIGPGDRRSIKNHPILLIDDEADHYSVNTAKDDPETDPTAINGLVRKILACFEKSAYVGYTATAFANIFISLDDESEDFGDTLFPRDFMISVKPPSNYVGAQRVFGLSDPTVGDEVRALPIVRRIRDAEDWLPSNHKNHAEPGDFLPDSLEEAIDAFMLTIAVRRARGDRDKHNSMLVHVTRFNSVQERVTGLIDGAVRRIRTRLRQGDDEKTLRRLERLYESDHLPTTRAMAGRDEFGRLEALPWPEVRDELRAAVESVEIRTINGQAKDVLDYVERKERGLNVIAIGGNKLSRGLTLEGLSVSYYLRTSRAYDTLLQMGRWFGYRPGYADLCRLYTTPQLEGWYRDITVANAELLRDLDNMALAGGTPMEFGLRVRTHADGLMVSSPNKVRTAKHITLSFANQTREQVAYSRAPENKTAALESFERLLRVAEPHRVDLPKPRGRLVFEAVPGRSVAEFLRGVPTNSESRLTRTDLMADYVDDRVSVGELTEWRVVVLNPTQNPAQGEERRKWPINGHSLGLVQRASDSRTTVGDLSEPRTDRGQYRIKRLLGQEDSAEGLTAEQILAATAAAQASTKLSKNEATRRQRREGVLFVALLDPSVANVEDAVLDTDKGDRADPYVGLTVIFPPSDSPSAGRRYLIGQVYRQMELGWGEE